jgi:hypothetical protein
LLPKTKSKLSEMNSGYSLHIPRLDTGRPPTCLICALPTLKVSKKWWWFIFGQWDNFAYFTLFLELLKILGPVLSKTINEYQVVRNSDKIFLNSL